MKIIKINNKRPSSQLFSTLIAQVLIQNTLVFSTINSQLKYEYEMFNGIKNNTCNYIQTNIKKTHCLLSSDIRHLTS